MTRANNTFIPSRTSPKGSERGCLCRHKNIYSRECCEGDMWNQGVGVVTRTS